MTESDKSNRSRHQRHSKITRYSMMSVAVSVALTSMLIMAIATAQTPGSGSAQPFSALNAFSTGPQASESPSNNRGPSNSGPSNSGPSNQRPTQGTSPPNQPIGFQQQGFQQQGFRHPGVQAAPARLAAGATIQPQRLPQSSVQQASGMTASRPNNPLSRGVDSGHASVIQAAAVETSVGNPNSKAQDFATQVPGQIPESGSEDCVAQAGFAGDLISFKGISSSGNQLITVINASKQAICVYHVDESGIRLLSSRPIADDFTILFNATSPLPDEIRQLGSPAR